MNPTSTDEQHLQLLAIFHYVVGGITALFACMPLIHLGMGIAMLASPQSFGNGPAQQIPSFMGWMFVLMGGGFFLVGQALAVCMILAGRNIARRTRYTFVFVVACIECIFMPFGTALGVFTIIVLSRESVKRLFDAAPSSAGERVA